MQVTAAGGGRGDRNFDGDGGGRRPSVALGVRASPRRFEEVGRFAGPRGAFVWRKGREVSSVLLEFEGAEAAAVRWLEEKEGAGGGSGCSRRLLGGRGSEPRPERARGWPFMAGRWCTVGSCAGELVLVATGLEKVLRQV